MINSPLTVDAIDISSAWIEAVRILQNNRWKVRNLVVHIKSTSITNHNLHHAITDFLNTHTRPNVKQVAYTIFPHKLYKIFNTPQDLFKKYNSKQGFYKKIYHGGWGTYFRRMTHYKKEYSTTGHPTNQLQNIINAINNRTKMSRAAYSIVIQIPGTETTRQRGGPCLNYIAVQIEPCANSYQIGLLCIYRNHDFFNRAYGNYLGLCNLTAFIANETRLIPGPVTCISSNAYIPNKKNFMLNFLRSVRSL